jgi:hypothetical protein
MGHVRMEIEGLLLCNSLLFLPDSQPGPNGREINDGSKTQSTGDLRKGH